MGLGFLLTSLALSELTGAEVRVATFQNEVANYAGTTQFRMTAGGVVQSGLDVSQYYVDGNPFTNTQDDTFDVLRFDELFGSGPGQIPAGARIVNATLTITTGNGGDAQSPGPYMVGRLKEAVTPESTYDTWPLDPPETRSVRSILARPWQAGAADIVATEVIRTDVTAFVAAWSQGEPNHGLVFFTNDTTDGWQVSTVGNPEPALRPQLSVVYTTNAVNVVEFGADRSALVHSATPTVDGSTLEAAFLDFAPADVIEALLRFDILGDAEGRIGSQDEVLAAKIILQTAGAPGFSGAADSNDPIAVHRVLRDWTVESTFGVDGISVNAGEIAPVAAEVTGAGENSQVWADVTGVVKAWQSGQPNYGVNVKVLNTDGWQMFWPGAADPLVAPKLRIWSVRGTGIPTAQIAPTVLEGQAPFTVALDGSGSVDPQSLALAHAWTFGDGGTATGSQVTHQYTEPGLFTVTLTVRDPDGKEGTATVQVRVIGAPEARFSNGAATGVQPLPVDFNGSASRDADGGEVTWAWDFGDGATATGPVVEHLFRRGGRFTVRLTVTDDEGVSGTATTEVVVKGNSVQAAVFQEGVDGYTGTAEMRVRADGLVEFGRDFSQYYLDGRPQDANQSASDTCELIRFDNIIGSAPGQVPLGATVVKAMLTYWTGFDADAVTDGPYVIGLLTRGFDDATTYDSLDNASGIPEERGPRSAAETRVLAGFADIGALEVVSADVTPYVQRWVSGETNHGLTIFTDDTANGWQFRTVGNTNATVRPRLSVFYTTNTVVRREFQAVQSAVVYKGAPILDGSIAGPFWLDGEPPVADFRSGLMQFGDVFGASPEQVPAAFNVLGAQLVLQTGGLPDTSNAADSDDPFPVHPMLEAWTVASDFGASGVALGTQVGPAVAEFIGLGERARAAADITGIVAGWQNGTVNHGVYIHPGGSDGWMIFWPSPGLSPDDLTPRLVVLAEAASIVPEAPSISSLAPTQGDGFELTWVSVPGRNYQVEASVSLTGWVAQGGPVTAQGASTQVAIPSQAETARFFRVVLLP